jgi:hypothetical protein
MALGRSVSATEIVNSHRMWQTSNRKLGPANRVENVAGPSQRRPARGGVWPLNPSTCFDINKGKSCFLREIVYRVLSRRRRWDADGKLKRCQTVSGEINLTGLGPRADQDGDHLIHARGKIDRETAMRSASFPGRAAPIFLSGGVVPACNTSRTLRGDVYRDTALLKRIIPKSGNRPIAGWPLP